MWNLLNNKPFPVSFPSEIPFDRYTLIAFATLPNGQPEIHQTAGASGRKGRHHFRTSAQMFLLRRQAEEKQIPSDIRRLRQVPSHSVFADRMRAEDDRRSARKCAVHLRGLSRAAGAELRVQAEVCEEFARNAAGWR